MALISRRQLVQQTAFAATALYSRPAKALRRALAIFTEREQNPAPLDPAAIRKREFNEPAIEAIGPRQLETPREGSWC